MTSGSSTYSRADCEELSRALDAMHEPSQTGVVAVCALCRATTQDYDARGLRHDVQEDEAQHAAWYVKTFGRTCQPPPVVA